MNLSTYKKWRNRCTIYVDNFYLILIEIILIVEKYNISNNWLLIFYNVIMNLNCKRNDNKSSTYKNLVLLNMVIEIK